MPAKRLTNAADLHRPEESVSAPVSHTYPDAIANYDASGDSGRRPETFAVSPAR